MISGVNENDEKIIKEILNKYPYDFYYYGSRVKGDYTAGSDLDILVESNEEIPVGIIEKIELEFNESKIPYIVKLADRKRLEDYFYDLIKASLIKI